MGYVPGIDPELLEKLRRGVPLRMTRSGALLFDDEPVTHPRLQQALRDGLDLSDNGEPIVRLGPQWCYLTIEDTPLRVTGASVEPTEATAAGLSLRLDDGRTVGISPTELWDEPDAGLVARVPSRSTGRGLRARFTNNAQMDLADALTEGPSGEIRLRVGSTDVPIANRGPFGPGLAHNIDKK